MRARSVSRFDPAYAVLLLAAATLAACTSPGTDQSVDVDAGAAVAAPRDTATSSALDIIGDHA